jgi:hypothetical protein
MARNNWKNISGTWHLITDNWIKIGGSWTNTVIPWIKVSGVWKPCGDPPYLNIDKGSLTFSWDQTSCAGAVITISSNKVWTCSMSNGGHFDYGPISGGGDGTVTINCLNSNNDSSNYTDTINFYINTTLMASCSLTQYFYPNECF